MKIEAFLQQFDADFFTGVPDSALCALCDYLMGEKGISDGHVIAANEGNCVGLAAGAYLATGKTPMVYLQNSGIGNVMNPVASLMNREIYGIPCVFLVGWRGEPGTKDEPQHVFQGQTTLEMLQAAGITPFVIGAATSCAEAEEMIGQTAQLLASGRQVAFVFRRDALEPEKKMHYTNPYQLLREDAIELVAKAAGRDVVVTSTGKISRELFEIRERAGDVHCRDFLTVGSMGHTSSIALGIALRRRGIRVWCVEGDGSFLMHMGAAGVIGRMSAQNLVHIVLNNEAHESVGGMPTAISRADLCGIAQACGYGAVYRAENATELASALEQIGKTPTLSFLEIKVALGSRKDLGRPTSTPQANREDFMQYLAQLEDYYGEG